MTSPRWSVGGVGLVCIGLLLSAALLVPQVDRERLVGQGVARRLAADLEAFEAEGSAARGWFAAVEALEGDTPPGSARARVRLDGAPRRHAAIERALETQWNRYRAGREPPLPPLAFGPPEVQAADALVLELRVETAGDRVDVSGAVARGTLRREVGSAEGWPLPGRAALLPPLVALLLGLALGRTLLALFAGVATGAVLLAAPEAGAWAPLVGLWNVFAVYLRAELFDGFRLEILGFIAALVALVGIVSRAGGLQGLIDQVLGVAKSARSALLLTYGMGLAIFFDDYANCVLVGNTMRPVSDRLRVSREKLAYVVDSTAAPLAAISLLSTWIAFQVSVYSAQLPAVGIQESGYAVFLKTLPYRFYCLLTLFFVPMIIWLRRDFGPMAAAERRARSTGRLVREGGRPPISEELSRTLPAEHMPHDWRVAALPLATTCAVVMGSIFVDGGGLDLLGRDPGALLRLPGLTAVLLAGSGAGPLLDGALAGVGVALFLAGSNAARWGLLAGVLAGILFDGPLRGWLAGVAGFAVAGALGSLRGATARPHLPLRDLLGAGLGSARTLAFAAVLLLLAWMIGAVCRDLATADYLVALSSDALPPAFLPVLLFAVAALVAFSTGSSWSTMSILLPNVVALAASVGAASPLGAATMVALCISAVLEGAVFGDHCSPISDTTVLSSVAAGSDHLDHVRTQIPYALATAGAALLFGYAPLLWIPGWSPLWAYLCGGGALVALVLWRGQPIEEGSATPPG